MSALPQGTKPPALKWQVEVTGHRVRGWLEWPGNTLYRPLFGLFVNDRLARVYRSSAVVGRSSSLAGCWAFAGELPCDWHDEADGIKSVTCLELGVVLKRSSGQRAGEGTGGRLTLDDLLRANEVAPPPPANDGFLGFLSLPLWDQIDILYRSILQRPGDEVGLRARADEIAAGPRTVLDVRDVLVESEEFHELQHLRPTQPLNLWCSWGGLVDIHRMVLDPASVGGPSPFGLGSRARPFERYLATVCRREPLEAHVFRLLAADSAPASDRLKWLRANRAAMQRLRQALEDAGTPGAARTASVRPSAVVNLLPLMTVGAAGRRRDAAIETTGQPGLLARSRPLRLNAGPFRFVVSGVAATPQADASPAAAFAAEFAAGPVLLARQHCVVDRPGPFELPLSFEIAPQDVALLQALPLEGRVLVNGPCAASVTGARLEPGTFSDTPSYPAVDDWLPLCRVEPESTRLPDGRIASPAAPEPRAVTTLDGVALLPGAYLLVLLLERHEGAAELLCDVSVGLSDEPRTGSVRCRLDQPTSTIRLPFVVEEGVGPRVLRLVIGKAGLGQFSVRSVRIGPPLVFAAFDDAPDATVLEASPAPGATDDAGSPGGPSPFGNVSILARARRWVRQAVGVR
ncbi:MAG: hypothetical protein K2X11_20360 [Acetobacteraceae bacterium]|nr:hypothetical protein [Acetobacteraceae bacterium]